MTATELLAAARSLVRRPRPSTAGLWSRAAALLGRQALEAGLDELWSRRSPGVERASTKCQLLCLHSHLPELAGTVAHAWAALTNACHHHPYELSPTHEELERWLDETEAFLQAVWRLPPTRSA